MPNDSSIYLIDTDVLVRIYVRQDRQRIYDGVVSLARAGRVRTVRQVFDELKKFEDQYGALKEYRSLLQIPAEQQFVENVSNIITQLGENAPWLWEQVGGRNPDPADPWLIAVAATYGYTVVTNENPRSPKRIPAACRLPSVACSCIRGPHFLVEVGLVTEIKPEYIDPDAFFREGE